MKNQIWSAKCWHPNWKQREVAYHCLGHMESVCLSPSHPQLTGKHILKILMNALQFYFGGKGWVCRELVIKYWHSLSLYHLNESQTAFKSLFYWAWISNIGNSVKFCHFGEKSVFTLWRGNWDLWIANSCIKTSFLFVSCNINKSQ